MDNPTPVPAPKASTSIWQGTTPQLAFIFGIIAGAGVAAFITIFLVLPKVGSTKTASNNTTTTPTTTDTTPQTYGDVKAVSDSDYVRGSDNAKLTLVEYSDYECPFCKNFHNTMLQVMDEYSDDVRWVYRNFPLSFHANAPKEAEAAQCVGELGGQDKFWDFSDKIFERTTSNGTGFALDALPALAEEVGVNKAQFTECLDSGRMASRITAETTDGTNAGATGTPTTFIVGADGHTIAGIPGAEPFANVKSRIDAALAQI